MNRELSTTALPTNSIEMEILRVLRILRMTKWNCSEPQGDSSLRLGYDEMMLLRNDVTK